VTLIILRVADLAAACWTAFLSILGGCSESSQTPIAV